MNEPGNPDPATAWRAAHGEIRRRAMQGARSAILAMRASGEIGDDAFHRIEEELDWFEMVDGRREEL